MTLGIANVEEPPKGLADRRPRGHNGAVVQAREEVSRLRTSYRDDGVRIAAHGPAASDELPDVPAAAVTSALQTLYGFFVEHYAEIVAMPSSFTSVKQGWPLAVEPSELVNTVLSKMADRISQAKSATELADRADVFCRLGYVYRAMENENNDSGRRQLRLRPLPDDWEHREDGPAVEGPTAHDEDKRNIAVLVQTLRNRAERAAPSATCLTALHVRCWQAVVAGRGAQASLARELKVDPSRISQIKSSATAKVRETLYIAGVLAHRGTLSDADRIHACLDVYDTTGGPARALTTEQRARLATAALEVKESPANGQRVDAQAAAARYLRRKDKKELRERIEADVQRRRQFEAEFAELLHGAEVAQSSAIDHPHPNCTLNCDTHNPQHDRVIWHIEWT
jgi:hypothetical protein